MAKIIHQNLASGRWHKLSLAEQLANIGSELHRAMRFKEKSDKENQLKSAERVLELIDLTISDLRWQSRVGEITRLKEVICDLFSGDNIYRVKPRDLEEYFLFFAIKARS